MNRGWQRPQDPSNQPVEGPGDRVIASPSRRSAACPAVGELSGEAGWPVRPLCGPFTTAGDKPPPYGTTSNPARLLEPTALV